MLRLETAAATLVPEGRVLKREEFAHVLEAQGILDAARQEAAKIREEARLEFERMRVEGHQKGHEEGKAEIAERILDCVGQSAAYYSKVEDVMVDLVMRAVRTVLGEMDAHEVIQRVVKRALESTRNENHVTVRVAPAQADWLKQRIHEMVQAFPKIQFLDVQPDHQLAEDACVLETEMGVVDASLQTQLKAIEKALIRAMK
jgi:type III secretion protein L